MTFVDYDSLKCKHVKLDFELFERFRFLLDFASIFWFLLFLSQLIIVLYVSIFLDFEFIGYNVILTVLFVVLPLVVAVTDEVHRHHQNNFWVHELLHGRPLPFLEVSQNQAFETGKLFDLGLPLATDMSWTHH